MFRAQFLCIFFLYVRNAPSSNPSSELNCLDFLFLKTLQVPNVSPLHLSSVIFGASAFVEDLCGRKEHSVDRKGPGLKRFLFRTVWTSGTRNRGNRDCNFLECEVSRFDWERQQREIEGKCITEEVLHLRFSLSLCPIFDRWERSQLSTSCCRQIRAIYWLASWKSQIRGNRSGRNLTRCCCLHRVCRVRDWILEQMKEFCTTAALQLMKQLRLLVCNSQPFLYVRLCDFFFQ